MTVKKEVVSFGDEVLTLEVNRLAPQADGSVLARLGETVVLATVVHAPEPNEGVDFFPMLVDYEERLYAAGKIAGSRWVKREGRPSDAAILASRLIDRPLRPLFPKNYRNDVQIIVTVLSYDRQHEPAILAVIAASAALLEAGLPFSGPVSACKVGLFNDTFILNPKEEKLPESKMELVVAGTKDKILMLEVKAKEVSEETLVKAIAFAHRHLQSTLKAQERLISHREVQYKESDNEAILQDLRKVLGSRLQEVFLEVDRERQKALISNFEKEVLENLEGNYKQAEIKTAFSYLLEKELREAVLKKGIRPDGRRLEEIRPMEIQLSLLPRTHGSALFSRGETQVLSIVTLGAPGEEQFIETMEEETKKRFMHHYNFPPFSTGEIRPLRSVSRREIGHSYLVERALESLIPAQELFPYTIRVVSEVLSSNGSSSMASVCASSLALMDAGVPIPKHVAGISIGLLTDQNGKYKLLTDIQGIEDFAGDMDCKVAGTTEGVTAAQLDTKIDGLTLEIIEKALLQAKRARAVILEKMNQALSKPRPSLSPYAPLVQIIKVKPERIRDIIGPGGKTINRIITETNVAINIEPDGTVAVSSEEKKGLEKAVNWIRNLTREVKIGEVFQGRVTRVVDFGCFVEIWPGQEGLVHISELAPYRIRRVSEVVKVGDVIPVKVISIDEQGRINLSLKQARHQN